MSDSKQMTPHERLAMVRKAQGERAAKNPDLAQPTETPKRAAKLKRVKVLSQAAQKRLEKERQEAAKTQTEKLAERVVARDKAAAKHKSVQRNIDAIEAKKPKAPNLKVKPVKKIREQRAVKRVTEHDVFQAQIEERDRQHHILFKRADGIRSRMQKIVRLERVKLAEALRDCYGIYEDIENGKDPWQFYEVLRAYFKVRLERVQANTPDEGLLVRYVFSEKSNKQVSEYGTVLRYARENKIAKNNFIDWYTTKTQTKILAEARKAGGADYTEKLRRARQLLMRYFDIREEWPLGVMEYPLHLAEKQVHLPNDLILVICRGVNQFNRDIHFDPERPDKTRLPVASVRALHFIPPVIDFANEIINRLARFIVPRLEHYEAEISRKTEEVWANDLTALLTEEELGVAYKSADHWADRMQAGLVEDQASFVKSRRSIQKMRDKSRGR